MKKYYHNDEDKKFSGVINTLKTLPHISAPSDFEMNLKRKLNNLKYSRERQENKTFFLFRRSLIPAAALTLSIVILLLVVFQSRQSEENPFMTAPELKLEYSSNVNTTSIKDLLIDPINITSNDVVIKKKVSTPQKIVKENKTATQKSYTGLAGNANQPNLKDFLRSTEGHNVDRSLRAKPQTQSSGEYEGNTNYVSFDGFNLVNEDNDRSLYQLKARMDSLKKWIRNNR